MIASRSFLVAIIPTARRFVANFWRRPLGVRRVNLFEVELVWV